MINWYNLWINAILFYAMSIVINALIPKIQCIQRTSTYAKFVIKKVFIKKCTYNCSFCDNMNNELCNKDNHKNTFVKNYNCEHNICLECI